MIRHCILAAIAMTISIVVSSAAARATVCSDRLASDIPKRSPAAPNGAEFVRLVHGLTNVERETEIGSQLHAGNVPGFLRHLVPVRLHHELADGRAVEVTLCVARDYLSIGSDEDFLRIPMGLPTAVTTAISFGFMLPTKKMVDAIYEGAGSHLVPQPLPAGDEMRSTAYYADHNERIAVQRMTMHAPLSALMAGHKKDLVITNRLWSKLGRVAIYGWQLPDGTPIQPLSTVHGARYADYSHGVRLVSLVAYVDGRPRSLVDLLEDPEFGGVLSDEGPIRHVPELIQYLSGSTIDPATLALQAKRLVRADDHHTQVAAPH